MLQPNKKKAISLIELKNNNIVSCGLYSDKNIDAAADGKFIVALPGWGHYSYSINTSSDSAQFYFNQGLNMYYSYHPREALASFKEASRFDGSSPMTYWGQLLAMGPNYNSAHNYKMPNGVSEALQLVNKAEGNATAKEKDLIDVMKLRYSADTADTQRGHLNTAYANGMKSLVGQYPADPDIRALYIDAVMLIHPWDFWNNDGSPKEWTPELTGICESILKTNPSHPAGLHYYIHLTEASRRPEVALANAEGLKKIFPGVAHMVHMASHEYERNGLYAKGVEANDVADDNLAHYDSLANNISLSKHIPHYFAVQSYCALSGGMYTTGMRDALRCRNSVSPTYENTYDQYLYMMPVLTLVRLGKWKEILLDSLRPNSGWPYADLLYNFARGLAFVYTGSTDSAITELVQLRSKATDPILQKRRIPFNTALQGAGIAEQILNAAILFSQKKYDTAINGLMNAAQLEDKLIYTEPKDWLIPARQFLGAYLLKMGKPAAAEKVYREDLIWNPGNGWSLLGLSQSLKGQRRNKEIASYKAQYLQAFSHAEHIPPASVFLK